MNNTPRDWFGGLKDHWRGDLVASFSVAMVALPLALGVASAAGAEPITGLISAIIGGLVCSFFRASHVAVNGPAAGLITVVAAAIIAFNDGSENAYGYVLAVFAVSGAIQVLLGILKLGKLGSYIPSSVIVGIMAAIGVIIFSKEAHVAMGVVADSSVPLEIFFGLPRKISSINPFILLVAISGIFVLWGYPKIHNRLIHFIPAPMWVLVVSIPLGIILGFTSGNVIDWGIFNFSVGPENLVRVPSNILDAIIFPDFSRIGEPKFWFAVISITLIAFIQTMAMTRAVDRLDPHNRKSDLSHDLIGVGVGTLASAMVGGLPLITVIVRSTVNVTNGAVTRWANFFHGIILLIFVIVLAPVLQMVPRAALAAILVFTGIKLAGPKVFKDAFQKGWEQLLIVLTTLIVTLISDLLYGITCGVLMTFFIQYRRSGLGWKHFIGRIRQPRVKIKQKGEANYDVRIRGVANFLSKATIMNELEALPKGAFLTVDYSQTLLIDTSFAEELDEFAQQYRISGGTFYSIGNKNHDSSSKHPYALKIKTDTYRSMNKRQRDRWELALKHGWKYVKEMDWDNSYLRNFHFFQIRPVEYKENLIIGNFNPYLNVDFQVSDITFDEGITSQAEVHHCTVMVIDMPNRFPQFSMDREGRLDRIFEPVMKFSGHEDINFKQHPKFSNKYALRGRSRERLEKFFTPTVLKYLEENEVYHIESNGEALVVFKDDKTAKKEEVRNMLNFSYQLCLLLFNETTLFPDGKAKNTTDEPEKIVQS